ncbi:hypothetical protein V502_11521 [Pseudogymnoascus sp. VKM F-4520 (FW-2644)]|nr:hypothetical protein V502_11521 [Pseudogymnoascus sp. VKM F-4520 (FW-2644)]
MSAGSGLASMFCPAYPPWPGSKFYGAETTNNLTSHCKIINAMLSTSNMSLPLRTRRVATSVTSLTSNIPQYRTAFWSSKGRDEVPSKPAPRDHLHEDFVKAKSAPVAPKRGALSSSSIFEDEAVAGPVSTGTGPTGTPRNPRHMAAALDPDPSSRERWQRKMVIREITARGRLSKTETLKRSERVSHSKSHNYQTSVKKLGPLARQITGKPLEEAIVQMRFSKKKAAQGVREHLVHARNEAIVRRGMGLGKEEGFRAVQIKTKDGKRMKVEDPSRLYIEQAWVGKGDFGISPDHRARGQINMMKNPTTHIHVVLREEKTRIRESQEREAKLAARKTWVQLPNRKITSQRQFYSW